MADESRKQSLVVELYASRKELSGQTKRLHEDLSFGERLRCSIRENPAGWLGGAAAFGLLLSTLTGRKKKIIVKDRHGRAVEKIDKGSLAGPLVKLALASAKPAISSWMKHRVAENQ